jgi:hypothetical protein
MLEPAPGHSARLPQSECPLASAPHPPDSKVPTLATPSPNIPMVLLSHVHSCPCRSSVMCTSHASSPSCCGWLCPSSGSGCTR